MKLPLRTTSPSSPSGGILVLLVLPFALLSKSAQGLDGQYLYTGHEEFVKEYTGPGSAGDYSLSARNRVVEFYSPFCGHCQRFKDTYLEVAKAVPGVEFYAVSCVAHNNVCMDNSVRSWPSIYTFREGRGSDKEPWKNKGAQGFTAEAVEAVFAAAPGAGSSAEAASRSDVVLESGTAESLALRRKVLEADAKKSMNGEPSPDGGGGVDVNEDDRHDKPEDAEEDERDDARTEAKTTYDVERKPTDDEEEPRGGGDDESGRGAVTRTKYDNAENDDDEDDDDNADDDANVKEANAEESQQQHAQVHERVSAAHSRFVERKKRVDSSLASARKARLKELQQSGPSVASDGSPKKLRPGAQLAAKDTSDANRYKSTLAKQREEKGKKRVFVRDGAVVPSELQHPPEGATVTMRANRVGTSEYKSRRDELIASIRKHRGAARAKQVEAKLLAVENALNLKVSPALSRPAVPFRKVITKERVIERIPFMKRMVKMSHEEELILDASMSFIHGLRVGIFKDRKTLSEDEQVALEDWLHLVRVTLPSEWALHTLIDDLLDRFDSVVKSPDALLRVLDQHPLRRDRWSPSCAKIGNIGGFSCGFWKLLHVMSVGIAEHKGGKVVVKLRMARPDSPLFSPLLAADTIRDYIAHFFPCTSCAGHFIERYDDCSYRRCTRLSNKVSKSSEADWKELAKWLFQFHNEVSIRVLHEKADYKRKRDQRSTLLIAPEQGPGAASENDEISVLYPSIHDCVMCYNGDGSWNEDAVFVFLERQYWPAAAMDKRTARLLAFDEDASSDRDFNLTLLLLAVGMVLIYFLRDSLVGKSALQETMLRARAMRPKISSGSHKRSV